MKQNDQLTFKDLDQDIDMICDREIVASMMIRRCDCAEVENYELASKQK